MLWYKAVFCLEVIVGHITYIVLVQTLNHAQSVIYKRLQMWRHNDVIGRNEYLIYRSLGIFTAIFV